MRFLTALLFLNFLLHVLYAQEGKKYLVKTIMFYNVENLFDTINDPDTWDDDRTPEGKYHWTSDRYMTKLDRIAEVIAGFEVDGRNIEPDLIALCEVENESVLRDLIYHDSLRSMQLGIIHRNSPDRRGMDVALLYKKSSFNPDSFQKHQLLLQNEDFEREFTRDQLVISGFLDDYKIYLIINHWPSRRGGEKRSRKRRLAAANLSRKIMDSINKIEKDPKLILLGDFNDNPTDMSIRKGLLGYRPVSSIASSYLFNPMERMYQRGFGSLAYRDQWSLFDQIIISKNMMLSNDHNYSYWKAGIYYYERLTNSTGRYKGYPKRTYAGTQYNGGYSDHFPVFLLLTREVYDPALSKTN